MHCGQSALHRHHQRRRRVERHRRTLPARQLPCCFRRARPRRRSLRGTAMPTPAVSVLIPTYNSQRYLVATVESVLAQTDGDFELLFCDDGSTDSTMDMLAAIAEQDERVRVYRNERNLGLHGNLVHLVHLARGRYIKILMADDLLFPDALARLRAPLDEHPSVVLSTSRRL